MRQKQLPRSTPERISRVNFLNRREIGELPNLLTEGEQVLGIVGGFYTSGSAILCVTSKRLLLLDKKTIRLNFEDARIESISELNYSHNGFMAVVKVFMAGRELEFRSWYKHELRLLAQFVQHKMAEVRNHTQQFSDLGKQLDTASPAPLQYQANPQLEKYLSERIARWRRANRFIDNLPKSVESQTLEQAS